MTIYSIWIRNKNSKMANWIAILPIYIQIWYTFRICKKISSFIVYASFNNNQLHGVHLDMHTCIDKHIEMFEQIETKFDNTDESFAWYRCVFCGIVIVLCTDMYLYRSNLSSVLRFHISNGHNSFICQSMYTFFCWIMERNM